MLLSIVVPAFNEEGYLGETLASLNRARAFLQREGRFEAEIIVQFWRAVGWVLRHRLSAWIGIASEGSAQESGRAPASSGKRAPRCLGGRRGQWDPSTDFRFKDRTA